MAVSAERGLWSSSAGASRLDLPAQTEELWSPEALAERDQDALKCASSTSEVSEDELHCFGYELDLRKIAVEDAASPRASRWTPPAHPAPGAEPKASRG